MKVLVTGGTGFIGSKLVKELVKKGYQTKCLVRQASKTDLLRDMGVELVTGDITNKDSLNGIAGDVDIVYHLAAIVDHTNTTTLSQHNNVSITGTKNLVDCFLGSSLKKFVYFSSNAAIGVRDADILLDETVPCNPTTHYGTAKLETEKLLLSCFNSSGFPVNIIRPPGPIDKQLKEFSEANWKELELWIARKGGSISKDLDSANKNVYTIKFFPIAPTK